MVSQPEAASPEGLLQWGRPLGSAVVVGVSFGHFPWYDAGTHPVVVP